MAPVVVLAVVVVRFPLLIQSSMQPLVPITDTILPIRPSPNVLIWSALFTHPLMVVPAWAVATIPLQRPRDAVILPLFSQFAMTLADSAGVVENPVIPP